MTRNHVNFLSFDNDDMKPSNVKFPFNRKILL